MMDNKERVKSAVDLVSYIQTNGIVLKKESRLFVGLCPFHAEKSGSFTVYPETQSFHCFGCHIDGDVYTFAMKRHNWTFPEALEELARYANITLEVNPVAKEKVNRKERLHECLEAATQWFTKQWKRRD
jgi:DNA primase